MVNQAIMDHWVDTLGIGVVHIFPAAAFGRCSDAVAAIYHEYIFSFENMIFFEIREHHVVFV